MNWPIMGNIPELLVNSRPMITLRLSCLWWPERNTLKVGRLRAQNCVYTRIVQICFFFFPRNNLWQEKYWSLGEALQTSQMLLQHLRYSHSTCMFVFLAWFNCRLGDMFVICLSLLGDCPRYQRLSGASQGERGHHFCPPWRPQLPRRSPSDGRSRCVLKQRILSCRHSPVGI